MGGGLAFGGPGNEATIVFEPQTQGAGQATPIRVPPAEQERKLITKVYPRSGSDAYGDDRLRFVVVIGKDGHIVREILIDGSSWLRRAAVEALGRWVYEPTLVNGEPVEVVTEVRVDFQAGE
jgi:protein TonB